MSITEIDKQYVANTYARFPVELVSGKGAILKDSEGKEYIDLGSGIAVNVFGVADDEWLKAVTDQLSTLTHTSNLYFTEPCSTLAKMLCERTGMKKAFLATAVPRLTNVQSRLLVATLSTNTVTKAIQQSSL